jgi:hypothetical protein
MSVQDRTALFHQINYTVAYIGRIAFAIYFLAPLGQGDFATAKYRFLFLGVPFLAMYALTQAGSLLGSAYEWSGRQILHARWVQEAASRLLGAEVDPEIGLEVWKFAANLAMLGGLVWWGWTIWGGGRR